MATNTNASAVTPAWISDLITSHSDIHDAQDASRRQPIEHSYARSPIDEYSSEHLINNNSHQVGHISALESQAAAKKPVNLQMISETIQISAVAIREMVRHTEAISLDAQNVISRLQSDLDIERARVRETQNELESFKAENERLANESVRRCKEFQALTNSLTDKLTATTHELEIVKGWMSHFNTQINSELIQAVSEAEEALKKFPKLN